MKKIKLLKRMISAVTGAAMMLPITSGYAVTAADSTSDVEVNFAIVPVLLRCQQVR